MDNNNQCKTGGGDNISVITKRAVLFLQNFEPDPESALDSEEVRELICLGAQENPAMVLREMVKHPVLYKSSHYMAVIQNVVEAYTKVSREPKESEKSPLTCLVDQYSESRLSNLNIWVRSGVMVLTELLMPLEESQETKSKSLRMLVKYFDEDCKHPGIEEDSEEVGGEKPSDNSHWKKFISDVKSFLSQGADPTWHPEGSESSALGLLLKNLLQKVVSGKITMPRLRELIPLLLNSKSLDAWRKRQSYSTLHTIFDVNCSSLLLAIKKRIQTGASLPLVITECKDAIRLVLEYDPGLSNSQDPNGLTILHKLSYVLFRDPNFTHLYLAILPIVINRTNVNTVDNKSVTPYSYIQFMLKNIRFYLSQGHRRVISRIDGIFLQNGADCDLAANGLSFIQCYIIKRLLSNASMTPGAENGISTILQFLESNGRSILEMDDFLLVDLINHAKFFLNPQSLVADQYIKAVLVCINSNSSSSKQFKENKPIPLP